MLLLAVVLTGNPHRGCQSLETTILVSEIAHMLSHTVQLSVFPNGDSFQSFSSAEDIYVLLLFWGKRGQLVLFHIPQRN